MQFAAFAKLCLGREEEAVAWLNRSIELRPSSPMAHFFLAAAFARLGRLEDAREAARAGLELNPSFTIALYRSSPLSDNPIYLAGRERIMRACGWRAYRRGDHAPQRRAQAAQQAANSRAEGSRFSAPALWAKRQIRSG
jgi:tetratricopeptide (TPR) repeat protein